MRNGHLKIINHIKKIPSIGRMLIILLFLFFGTCFLISCNRNKKQPELLIGAAASTETAMKEVQVLYQNQKPEVKIAFTYASSGTLEKQIREGAPIDVFLSAAKKQMEELSGDDFLVESSRVDLLNNEIVLIVPKESNLGITGIMDMTKAGAIAIGDPESVPAGQYAKEILEYLGIWDEVNERATLGKDVTEVLAWVSSGNADAGMVYKTDAIFNDNVEIVAYAPEESYPKADYPVAVIKNSKEKELAADFIDFLDSEEVEEIFIKYGFGIID